MTRSVDPDEEIWGSREELLLASAVSRHGPQNWQSIAMEVQKRSPVAALLTPQSCEKRFRILQRRFTGGNSGIDGKKSRGGAESDAISLLEELRKIRVAELRREVERYDVSILSLQLKVKGLKEDRERAISEEHPAGAKEKEKENGDIGRSCNESNSSGRKPNHDSDAGTENGNLNGATIRGQRREPPAADPAAGEESYNGSSDTIAKCTEASAPGDEPAAKNSGESMAESKEEETSEEDASKEGSDVQSSASPSRRRFRRRTAAVSGGSSGGDDAEADEVSPRSKTIVARSHPWSCFLEIFRSSKLGSTFEQRLQSQETTEYRSLIRQHIDLAMVRGKMAEGMYARDVELYRDLLLLCSNAVVFFPKDSMEHSAGVQLRVLVRKQISATVQKPSTALSEEVPLQPAPPAIEPDPEDSQTEKPVSDAPPLSSRKRNLEEEDEEEDKEEEKEEVEEAEKKRAKERSGVVAVRRMRTGKGRGKVAAGATEVKNSGGGAPNISAAKKRSAVNFLSRISRNGTLLETLKSSGRGKKDQSSDKQTQDQSVPVKRGVGRPPKRPPPPQPQSPLPPPPAAKRGRAAEAAASGKKRGRR